MLRFQAMNVQMFRLFSKSSVILLLLFSVSLPLEAQLFPRGRKDTGPKPKNIHGAVQDARGKAIVGARVYVRDMKTNVVRTLTTDQEGLYKVYALPPTGDYEVYAELKGKASEKKVVSSFLNREDNVINFQLDVDVEVDDVVFAVQEGADDLFLRSLPFQLGIDLVVPRWGQRINLVKAFLVGCQRPHDIRFHVPYVDARADNRFAAGILNGAMNVLRLGPGILPPAGEQLRLERKTH